MKRFDFIKNCLLNGAALISASTLGIFASNTKKESAYEPIGFNHLPNKKNMMKKNSVLHLANTRGKANHGWLNSHHTFSFANYYNPDRMNFGVLRVLNDDIVAPSQGFGKHPHDNMEIISIPLQGALAHEDSMGNQSVIKQGDIQIMSAGTGVQHSEYNASQTEEVKFLQIWLFPNKKNVTPRYDQITLNPADKVNRLQQILSPNPEDEGVWIHQNAWFHLGQFAENNSQTYKLHDKNNGVYFFVLKGTFEVEGQELNDRDGLGIWDVDSIHLTAKRPNAEILIMEVPMNLS